MSVCSSHWGEKQSLLIIIPLIRLIKKSCLNKSKFPSLNLLRKINFLSIRVLLSEIVFFLLNWEFFVNFPKNVSKQQRSIVLLYVAHFEEKISFCLYLSSFTALNKKGCLQQILIFLWICTFSNLLRKTNFLIISELLSEITNFLNKKRSFQWVSPKMIQNNRKA